MANEFKAKNGLITPNVVVSSNATSATVGKLTVYGGVVTDAGIETGLSIMSSNTTSIPAVISGSTNGILQISGGGTSNASQRGAQVDLYGGNNSSGLMVFRTGNAAGGTSQAERMRIQGDGNIGINTNVADAKLHIEGTFRQGYRTRQTIFVSLVNADAAAGKRIRLSMPGVTQWSATVTIKVSRPIDDATGTQISVASFDVVRSGGNTGANAVFVVTNNFEDTRTAGFSRAWYFDNSSGIPVLRFGQTANSANYHITIDYDSSNSTSNDSMLSTAVVDDGTAPPGTVITASSTIAIESGAMVLKTNAVPRMNFIDSVTTLGTPSRTDMGGATRTFQIERNSQASMSIVRNSADSLGPVIIFGKSRGTTNGSNTATSAADELGTMAFVSANGTAMASQVIDIRGTVGANNSGVLAFRTINDQGGAIANRIAINETGAIGLGANAPLTTGAHVHVYANTATNTELRITNPNTDTLASARLTVYNDANNTGGLLIRSSNAARPNSTVVYSGNDLSLFAFGSERMTVKGDANGHVGVATTAPTERLSVAGGNIIIDNATYIKTRTAGASNAVTRIMGVNSANVMYVGGIDTELSSLQITPTANAILSIAGDGVTTISSGNIVTGGAYTSTSTTQISPSGLMLITNNTGAANNYTGISLQIKTDAGSFGRSYIGAIGGTGSVFDSHIVFGRRTGSTAYGETMRIANDGNVGIGTAAPAFKLDVSGTGRFSGNLSAGNISATTFTGNLVGNVSGNISGNLTIAGANTQVAFNDDGIANTSSGFTFNKTSNTVTVTGKVISPSAQITTLNNRKMSETAVDNLFCQFNVENTVDYVGVKQTALFTTVADVSGSLASKYFIVHAMSVTAGALDIATSTEMVTAIWFTVGGTGTQPTGTGATRFIPVALALNDSASAVAAKIAAVLATDVAINGTSSGASLYVTNRTPGAYTAPTAGNSGFTWSVTVTGSGMMPFGATNQYLAGVLAPNGKIYFIPYNASTVLVVDPITNTSYTFGNITTAESGISNGRYFGGVLAPNGKIYCAPGNASKVLVIDPVTETISYLATDLGTTAAKWANGCLAPNGKIYCAPSQTAGFTLLLIIDTLSDSVSTIDISIVGYGTGTLAHNGKIYFNPVYAGNILVVNPQNNSWYTFGSVGTNASARWINGTLAPDGMIYAMPLGVTTQILKIDPFTDTHSFVTSTVSGIYRSSLGANGKIYGGARSATRVPVYDPETDTLIYVGPPNGTWSGSVSKWFGGVLAPNGKIYFTPFDAKVILTIDTGSSSIPNWYLSAYHNKG